MDQRDFTKNYRNTSKVEHEGGNSLNEDQGMDRNSIEDDDERRVMVPGEASVSQKSKAGLSKSMEKTKPEKDEILCEKCPTCKIVKTPRVYHCPICDVCISVHDHHCPLIGACIG